MASSKMDISLKVLELYCGIGGMHFALQACGIPFEVVASIDINPLACSVYKHNFSNTTVWEKNIEGLRSSQMDRLCVDLIVMSPPCQPFTRVGLKQDISDPRTKSFLHILDVVSQMKYLPDYLLLENVKGFETSKAHDELVKTMKNLGYTWQGFLISPKQIGIPNSRLRYYFLAKKSTEIQPEKGMWNQSVVESLPSDFIGNFAFSENLAGDCLDFTITADSPNKDKYSNFEPGHSCKPIERYLEQNVLTVKDYALPKNVIERYLSVMDIVTPHSKASTCFTKSYAKYVEGTGSILSISKSVDEPQLRYFTPREVANLMGFPKTFQFPESLSRQQKYRLLGNSLNVLVVAHLLSILIK